MNQRSNICGAVDIGGTNIRAGLVDKDGRVLSERRFATMTGEGGAQTSAQAIVQALSDQCQQANIDTRDLAGIGVVCAGPVDALRGVVNNPYTLPGWDGFCLTGRLHELTGLDARLEHDVNGALMGEVFLNGWQGKRVLMIAFGTGIGVAVYDKTAPFRAGAKYHPEMGHVVVDSGARNECYCGHGGCFESVWAGPGLKARAEGLGYGSFQAMFEMWKRGSDAALEQEMRALLHLLCTGVWNLMCVFKPDVLVLGGGLMQAYFAECKQAIEKDTQDLPDFLDEFEIVQASGSDGSAIVGASRLIFG